MIKCMKMEDIHLDALSRMFLLAHCIEAEERGVALMFPRDKIFFYLKKPVELGYPDIFQMAECSKYTSVKGEPDIKVRKFIKKSIEMNSRSPIFYVEMEIFG